MPRLTLESSLWPKTVVTQWSHIFTQRPLLPPRKREKSNIITKLWVWLCTMSLSPWSVRIRSERCSKQWKQMYPTGVWLFFFFPHRSAWGVIQLMCSWWNYSPTQPTRCPSWPSMGMQPVSHWHNRESPVSTDWIQIRFLTLHNPGNAHRVHWRQDLCLTVIYLWLFPGSAPLPPVGELRVQDITHSSMRLFWDAAPGPVRKYLITYKPEGGEAKEVSLI